MNCPFTGCYSLLPPKRRKTDKNPKGDPYWDAYFKKEWSTLREKLENVSNEVHDKLMNSIESFLSKYKFSADSIPALTMFTGISLSDHEELFERITSKVVEQIKCRIVYLQPTQSNSVRNLVESIVYDFVYNNNDGDDDMEDCVKPIKKSLRTLPFLHDWYINNESNNFPSESDPTFLIIVISNIEAYPAKILREFVAVLSTYRGKLPIMLFLGVATTLNAIHNTFSYRVLSKLSIHLFRTQPSIQFLNDVADKVFLKNDCPFQLSAEVYKFLTYSFLHYNFSIKEFIYGVELCIIEHFKSNPRGLLCCEYDEIEERVDYLIDEDLKDILDMDSMQKYCNSRKCDDSSPFPEESREIKKKLCILLRELHINKRKFIIATRAINIMMEEVPDSPFGYSIRENYVALMTESEKSEKLNNCLHRWQFLSKDAILNKLKTIRKLLQNVIEVDDLLSSNENIRSIFKTLKHHIKSIEGSSLEIIVTEEPDKTAENGKISQENVSRKSPCKSVELEKPTKNIACTRDDAILSGGSPLKEFSVSLTKEESPCNLENAQECRRNLLMRSAKSSPAKSPLKVLEKTPTESPCKRDSPKSELKEPCRKKLLGTPTKTPSSPAKRKTPEKGSPNLSAPDTKPDQVSASPSDISKFISSKSIFHTSLTKSPKFSRAEFKQGLLSKLTKEKKLSEFDSMKKLALEYLMENFFKVFLMSLQKWPLHEALLFDNITVIQKRRLGTQKCNLYHSLRRPRDFLGCECCSLEDSDNTSMPDICIAFRIYSESGNQINLHDWLQAFSVIVDKENSNSASISSQVHARFSQAVKELQFLGFIAPSRNKVEHVMKLTYDMFTKPVF